MRECGSFILFMFITQSEWKQKQSVHRECVTLDLFSDKFSDHTVEIVEERDHVKTKFHPTFTLSEIENVCIHDGRGIVDAESTHDWTCTEFIQMIGNQWHIDK